MSTPHARQPYMTLPLSATLYDIPVIFGCVYHLVFIYIGEE